MTYAGGMRKLIVSDSSNVRSLTFDTDHIVVEFVGGSVYRYEDCTLEDFRAACAAESVGKWVQATLVRQPTKHPFVPISKAPPPSPLAAEIHALRTIASLRFPKGVDHAIVDAARAALEGRLPPPTVPEWDVPTVVRGTTEVQGIEWPSILGKRVPSVDEAEAIAYALASAALSARDA